MSSASFSVVLLVAATGQVNRNERVGTIREDEFEYQIETFEHWWGQPLSFDARRSADRREGARLPRPLCRTRLSRPGWRHDSTPCTSTTTRSTARNVATDWERRDMSVHRNGRSAKTSSAADSSAACIRVRGPRVPTWYGHCNGWTAATIRHAEPQKSVVRNGVTFTPADIKGLLAEIYMYSPTEHLGGLDDAINPAMLHVTLANWIGLGSHPVGMEAAMGEVVINYPLYAYKATVTKLSDRQHEVKNVDHLPHEHRPRSRQGPRTKAARCTSTTCSIINAEGKITGGRYYGDSARDRHALDAAQAGAGGEKGNERGNPHVDVKEVLAIWRESVREDIRKQVAERRSDRGRSHSPSQVKRPSRPKRPRAPRPLLRLQKLPLPPPRLRRRLFQLLQQPNRLPHRLHPNRLLLQRRPNRPQLQRQRSLRLRQLLPPRRPKRRTVPAAAEDDPATMPQ